MLNDRESASCKLDRTEVGSPIHFWLGGEHADFSTPLGLGVSVLRSCIINMIFFSNFEFIKKNINALDV